MIIRKQIHVNQAFVLFDKLEDLTIKYPWEKDTF